MSSNNIPRVTQKIFAENAGNNIGQFGSALAGQGNPTGDIAEIQALPAWGQGWAGAVISERDYPPLEEMTGVQKVASQQIAYLLQKGIPEWDEGTTYFANISFCQINGIVYQSLTNNNIGNNPANDTTNWSVWKPLEGTYANIDLSNLSATGLDKLNQSKALETGSVSSDADVYADVQKYAHSTFDLSKFTVIGSPVITEDGIETGATSGDNVRVSFTPQPNTTYRVDCKYYVDGSLPQTEGYIISGGFFELYRYSTSNAVWNFNYRTAENTVNSVFNFNNIDNTTYHIFFEFNITTLNLTVGYKAEGENEFTTHTTTMQSIKETSFIQIGSTSNALIDLKSISITADGVPVFSGNKTGIDVIKPDNYEVVGTPTITEDGIAGGFDTNSYIISAENFNLSAKKFKIKYHCKIGQPEDSIGVVSLYNNQGLPVFNTVYNYYKIGVILRENFSGAGDISSYTSNYTGLSYTANFEIENNTVTINVLYDDGTTRTANVDFSELDVSSWDELQLRVGRGIWIGKNIEYLDLNSVELENNGNLVYQPCLKIPYTQSKTGSKIVDAVYRDRVQDMYEQYGYAPYYTIDEENENFTLPMGEIYGMIAQNKTFDGFSLFDTKLTDRILTGDEALGWALQGSLVTMTYPDAVNRIKELYTAGTDTTYRGISCKKTTDGRYIADISQKTAIDTFYSETGIADFYILDSTNNQFYLPRNRYFMQLTDSTTLLNNYNEPGLPNITGGVKVGGIGSQPIALQDATGAFTLTESGRYMTRAENSGNQPSRFELDASLSSSIYGNSETVQPPSSNKLLYYKVGHTVTNSGSIDVANVLSDINLLESNKADKDLSNCTKPYVTETYVNGTSWYRLWSDGWCEQGGQTAALSASTQTTIELLKEYSNTDYFINVNQPLRIGELLPTVGIYQKNTANFIVQQSSSGNNAGAYATLWYACGF